MNTADDVCEDCGEDLSGGSSHYHCAICGNVTGMMGDGCHQVKIVIDGSRELETIETDHLAAGACVCCCEDCLDEEGKCICPECICLGTNTC